MDEDGQVLNAGYAGKRATDDIKRYFHPSYKVDPEFENWEVALHGPPPLTDLV